MASFSSKFFGLIFGVLFVIGIWVALILWSARDQARYEEAHQSKTEYLRLAVGWGRDGVALKNIDPHNRTYRNLIVRLNMDRSGSSDADAGAGDLAPGKSKTVAYFNFTDDKRKRFNIFTTAVETVFVKGNVDGVKAVGMFLCLESQTCVPAPDR